MNLEQQNIIARITSGEKIINPLAGQSEQSNFETTFEIELPIIYGIVQASFDRMLQELASHDPKSLNRNSKPNRVNEFQKGLLFEKFPGLMKEASGTFFLRKGSFRINFKKLDSDLKPSYILTNTARRKLWQAQLGIFAEDHLIDVFLGYIPNTAWDDIMKVCAVYIANNQLQWICDLKLFNEKGLVDNTLFNTDLGSHSEEDDLIVRPKTKSA